jgi:O-antigen/teichoic acid export membrane protein
VVALLIYVSAPHISVTIFDTPRHAVYFRIAAVTMPFFLGMGIFKQLLRVSFAPGRFNIVSVGYAILYTLLGIVLVVRMQMGVSGILLAMLAAAAVFALVGAVFTRRFLSPRFSLYTLREMLQFSVPILPSLFACWVMDFSDRYFLTKLSTLEQVGIYSVGARISSMIILLVTSYQMAWAPYALSVQHREDARDRYARGLFLFLLISLAAGTAIVVFGRPILVILTHPRYYGAEKVIGLLVLATVAYGTYLIMNIGLIITKKTSLTSISVGAGAVLNLVLNFALIPRFGMMGAAAATLISYALSVAGIYWFANRVYPIDYRFKRIAKLVALSVAVMFITSVFGFEDSLLLDVVFGIVLFAVFLMCIWRLFFRDSQTDQQAE